VALHFVRKTSEKDQSNKQRDACVRACLRHWQDRPHLSPSATSPISRTASKMPRIATAGQFKPLCALAGAVLICERSRREFPSKKLPDTK
jgi:hypothetical protein